MASRLPTNAINNLEDILALCRRARCQWTDTMDHAKKTHDIIGQAHLGQLRDTIAEIERKARDARSNRYEDEALAG